jgi:hypothetical protein
MSDTKLYIIELGEPIGPLVPMLRLVRCKECRFYDARHCDCVSDCCRREVEPDGLCAWGETAEEDYSDNGICASKGDDMILPYVPVDRYGVPIIPGDTVWYADEYTAGGVYQDYVVSEIGTDGEKTYVKAMHSTKTWRDGSHTYDHRCFRVAAGERFADLSHDNPHERIASEDALPSRRSCLPMTTCIRVETYMTKRGRLALPRRATCSSNSPS